MNLKGQEVLGTKNRSVLNKGESGVSITVWSPGNLPLALLKQWPVLRKLPGQKETKVPKVL